MAHPTIDDIGREARDVVTGFSGHITGFSRYISGCDLFLISPSIDKDGKHVDARWFDENRLSVLKSAQLSLDTVETQGPGEPAPIK